MKIQDLLNEAHVIDPKVNYWLVRTAAGRYYDEFAINKRIGFGDCYLEPSEVLAFPTDREEFAKAIAPIIEEHTDSIRPGHTAGQFFRFYHEIKRGDVVIIPSESSEKLWVGRITDDEPSKFSYKDENGDPSCPHAHTRSVEWIAEKYRSDFNPKIVSLFFSHHAIVDANEYSQFINGAIYDFFIANDKAHLILRVETRQHIRARSLVSLFSNILDIANDFGNDADLNLDVDDIDIRLNLNSPGAVELISVSLASVLILGIIVVFITGGKMKSKHIELGTEGLIKQLQEFFNQRDRSKLQAEVVRQAIHDLEIKDPREITKILQKVLK